MSITKNSILTWNDLTNTVLSTIKSKCCNIDTFASDVPSRLKSGTPNSTSVWSYTTTGSGNKYVKQTFTFYAYNNTNLISTVSSSTVNNEWNTFLSAANINSRSNKIIQGVELTMAIGLFQQFMSFHLKRIDSRRQIFNTVETQTEYFGIKYVTGTCTPKYTLTPIEISNVPVINNNNINGSKGVIRENILNDGINWGILDNNNPKIHRVYLG